MKAVKRHTRACGLAKSKVETCKCVCRGRLHGKGVKCPPGYYATADEAARNVRNTVVPRACFIWNDGRGKCPWRVIPGTGCAHWVAHQLGLTGRTGCRRGYLIRVSDVISGRNRVGFGNARAGDLWTNSGNSHVGIVRDVRRDRQGRVTSVLVEHDSDSATGAGRGVVRDWKTDGVIRR